jgi:hypothetical protein
MTNNASSGFGTRTVFTQANFDNGLLSMVASCDGFLMASIGQPSVTVPYMGMLEGSTMDAGSGAVTSYAYTTASTKMVTIANGKKGNGTYYLPQPGNLTLTVRAGERWQLQLTTNAELGPAPDVEVCWTPDGASGVAGPAQPGSMREAMQSLRDDIQSGRLQANMLADAQRTIDERVADFSRVFGDATRMSPSDEDRRRFVQHLQAIVCRAMPAGQVADNRVDDAHMASLISTFAQVTGRDFGSRQKGLLDAGIRALVSINDNAASRGDLVLIKTNIDLFLENVEHALDLRFDPNQRRLLTRAVTRLVGDGRHA